MNKNIICTSIFIYDFISNQIYIHNCMYNLFAWEILTIRLPRTIFWWITFWETFTQQSNGLLKLELLVFTKFLHDHFLSCKNFVKTRISNFKRPLLCGSCIEIHTDPSVFHFDKIKCTICTNVLPVSTKKCTNYGFYFTKRKGHSLATP